MVPATVLLLASWKHAGGRAVSKTAFDAYALVTGGANRSCPVVVQRVECWGRQPHEDVLEESMVCKLQLWC
jgi:hypothetical protein